LIHNAGVDLARDQRIQRIRHFDCVARMLGFRLAQSFAALGDLVDPRLLDPSLRRPRIRIGG
jgi:hypothetical protein